MCPDAVLFQSSSLPSSFALISSSPRYSSLNRKKGRSCSIIEHDGVLGDLCYLAAGHDVDSFILADGLEQRRTRIIQLARKKSRHGLKNSDLEASLL